TASTTDSGRSAMIASASSGVIVANSAARSRPWARSVGEGDNAGHHLVGLQVARVDVGESGGGSGGDRAEVGVVGSGRGASHPRGRLGGASPVAAGLQAVVVGSEVDE